VAGYRTLLSTPMILQNEVVGVLSMWRTKVAPFNKRECELLEEFAVQGAIVMRQVALLRALESRGAELASKVAQREALREVGDAVGSTLDLDEVLDQIVSNAVRLTRTDGGSIMEYDESSDSFHVRAAAGSSPDLLKELRAITIDRESTLVGRAATAHRTLEVPDLADTELDPHLDALFRDGWRSVLAVPILRGERILGVLVIRRRSTGSFGPHVKLLETFAGQSALAIVNARLFGELQTKTRELEIASQHKSEFLASMSHELRTPLNAVIGFSEVLLDRMFGEINERQDEYLRDIWNSGRHLLELLNEILDLSKVEAGQMVLEPSTFSVSSALEYCLAMVRERATLHAITITVQVADEVGTIEADELRFKQVVLNLLSNAVKFTPDGGTVSLRAFREGADLMVTVADTGIGVPVEDQERIFESFQQGRRGAPKEEGTGLGLTLSRRIVWLFGGRMWLESTPGVGSTFGFSIPGVLQSGAEVGSTARDDLPVVLLVDDDRASLDLNSAYLDGSPTRVLRARDGVEALDVARKERPAAPPVVEHREGASEGVEGQSAAALTRPQSGGAVGRAEQRPAFGAPILQKVHGPGEFRRCEHCAPARAGPFGAFGPPNSQCAVVAAARNVWIGPEVGQVQHHQLAPPKPVGISDLECGRVTQRGQPALGSVAVRFVDEVVNDIEQMLQFGLAERPPSRRDGIVGGVLRSVPLKANLRRNIAELLLAERNPPYLPSLT
jgi:signal transduction histidine kinase